MTLYKLDEWEHNGRDDSDWYAVVYDSEKDELDRVQTGTTRFANALHCGPPMETPTEEVLLKAEAKLAKSLFSRIKYADQEATLEPQNFPEGTEVALLKDYKARQKTSDAVNCDKCHGSGRWVNPRNDKDVRQCFACSGLGVSQRNFRYIRVCSKCSKEFSVPKNETPVCECGHKKSKVKTKVYPAGLTGKALEQKSYGKFYSNGYNRPDRHNTSVLVKLDSGEEILVPANSLRLNQRLATDEEIERKAKEIAKRRNFYTLFRTAHIRL